MQGIFFQNIISSTISLKSQQCYRNLFALLLQNTVNAREEVQSDWWLTPEFCSFVIYSKYK